MKFYSVAVEERERVGGYTLLHYRWEGSVEPGQFVMARAVSFPYALDPFLARPLSYYDHDDMTASLLFEVRGRGTALLDRAQQIEVTAPLGKGFRIENNGRAALLGGGIGVAPMKILSRRLETLGIEHNVFLGFADAATAPISQDFPGASVATMDGSAGIRGTVLDAAPHLERYGAVYACGPDPMLAAVKCAVDGGCQLSVEERMGCGNGSCNGCVVPIKGRGYIRSCVEGPVFEAEALAW
ncbi:MAG: NAD-dependent dihydroorotate dehydrogenase B electron transfer subunit [Actinomycetota bacterium]|nr:NAD-dependent dihydroorotate dehydrogenase B electron transfer subunit [Actinomycetota bacterium]